MIWSVFKNYGRSKTYSNVQNEQFPRRHFYVPFGEFVHLHMQYYSFANTILKCAAFQFFTPAGKPTVIFYFLPPEGGLLRKTGLFPNISVHRRNVRPDLLRAWWVSPELSKTAIVIRVETINDYFPYRNPPKAEMLLWALDGFSLIAVGQKEQKGQNRAGIILTDLILLLI